MTNNTSFDSTRRKFLRNIAIGAASLIVLPVAANAQDGPPPSMPPTSPANTPPVFVDLGPHKKYMSADWTKVTLPVANDSEIVYLRYAKKIGHEAVSARCTHRGCPVDYTSSDSRFVCPCHGGIFDENGVNVSGPPKTPLLALATKVDAKGRLFVAQPPKFVPHRSHNGSSAGAPPPPPPPPANQPQ